MKIYDCFTFFNELDLLEIRLNELNNEVDYFVLVEASYTHQGNQKPLYFELNKSRFLPFLGKIIHVVVSDIPDEFYNKHCKTWILENHQRNCISRGIVNANDSDLIIISDVDEIPRATTLSKAKNEKLPVVFSQTHHAYFLNCIFKKPRGINYFKKVFLSVFSKKYERKLLRDNFWLGSVMVSKKSIQKPQHWRNNRENTSSNFNVVENGGWHFTFLGGVDKIIEKLNALNEEFDYSLYKNVDHLKNALLEKKAILPNQTSFELMEDEKILPSFVIENREKFNTYFYPH